MAGVQPLRADTEYIAIVGPFVDKDNPLQPETGLLLADFDVCRMIKHGSTTAIDVSGATWADITNMSGYYAFTFTTSYTDTEGNLKLAFQDDDVFLPVSHDYVVMNAPAFDALYAAAATDYLQVDVRQWLGVAVTADSNVPEVHVVGMDDGVITAAKLGADCITAAKIADDTFSSEHFATGCITSDALAAGCITAAALAADCITSSKIADDAIGAEHLAAGTITADTLAADCITAAKIADDAITNDHLASDIDFTTTQKAAINAEILDTLTVDTYAEIAQADPPAATSIAQMINYTYRFQFQKFTQTSNESALWNNAGTQKLLKRSTSSDGTTLTLGKYGSGA